MWQAASAGLLDFEHCGQLAACKHAFASEGAQIEYCFWWIVRLVLFW